MIKIQFKKLNNKKTFTVFNISLSFDRYKQYNIYFKTDIFELVLFNFRLKVFYIHHRGI